MDQAEIKLIRKAIIMERAAKVFIKKSARPPSWEIPLKIPRHLVLLLAIWKLIAKGEHSSISGLLFNTYSYYMSKFGSCCQWRNDTF